MIWDLLLKANWFCSGDHFSQLSAPLMEGRTKAGIRAPSSRV